MIEKLTAEFPVFYPRLYRLVRARIPHIQDAEDLVSKTVETMMRQINTFDPAQGDMAGWAFGIAKNHILHYWRGRRETVDIESIETITGRFSPPETELDCQRLMETLSPEEQSLLILRYVDGYSAEELAPRFGKSPAAFRQQLHRLKRRLKQLIIATTYE